MTELILKQYFGIDRQALEQLALERVCHCQYSALVSCLHETPLDELLDIVYETVTCELTALS